VHVGETFNRFASDLDCELHKNVFGGRTGRSCSAPSDPLAVIRGGEGGKWKDRVENREGTEGREARGREGRENKKGIGRRGRVSGKEGAEEERG